MPIIKSAIKKMHQDAKRRLRNSALKRSLKAAIKNFSVKTTADNLKKAQSQIDKAVKKNLLNKNTAARRKANLAKIAKEAKTSITGTKKVSKKTTANKARIVKKSTSTKK